MLERLRKFVKGFVIGAVICAAFVSSASGQSVWRQSSDHGTGTGFMIKTLTAAGGTQLYAFTDEVTGAAFRANHFWVAFGDTLSSRLVMVQRFRLGPSTADTTWIDPTGFFLYSDLIGLNEVESELACDGFELTWGAMAGGLRKVLWEAYR